MDWDFVYAVEYVGGALLTLTSIGVAMAVIETLWNQFAPMTDQEREDMSNWW